MNEIERQYQRKMEAALRKGDFQLFESIRRQYDITPIQQNASRQRILPTV